VAQKRHNNNNAANLETCKIINSQFDEISFIYRKLFDDATQSIRSCKDMPLLHPNRRCAIYLCFAFLEAMTYRLELVSLLINGLKDPKYLNNKKIKILYKNGVCLLPEHRKFENADRRTFIERLKGSLKEISAFTNIPLDLSTKNNELDQLKKAKRIRDRITHPRTAIDLEVTNQDLICIMGAVSWYNNTFSELVENHS
jgi:hypothetical protein